MNNAELYASIVNAKEIIQFILNISYVCLGINGINWFINIKNEKEVKSDLPNNRFGIIEFIGSIFIVSILIFLVFLICKNSKIISLLAIPSFILCFYIVYIKSMIKNDEKTFDYDYSSYGSLLVFTLTILNKFNFKDLFVNINNESSLQVVCIIIILFEIYAAFYCLLLNLYFVIKSLGKVGLEKLFNKYKVILKKINDLISFSEINLEFKYSNSAIEIKKTIKKILFFIPSFVYDVIRCCFIYVISIIFSFFLTPILFIIRSIFYYLVKISKTNENQVIYGITKMVSVFTIILVYILLQANIVFKQNIISVYEFISTAILIPIILEGLNYFKQKITSNS